MRCCILRHLIWVYTVWSDLSVQIHMVNMVISIWRDFFIFFFYFFFYFLFFFFFFFFKENKAWHISCDPFANQSTKMHRMLYIPSLLNQNNCIKIILCTLNIQTFWLLIILGLKFEDHSATRCVLNSRWVANNIDSDQMSHSTSSDLGLHCLLGSVCLDTCSEIWIFRVNGQTAQSTL